MREKLWEMVADGVGDGAAVLMYAARNEQGYAVRVHGEPRREIVDIDGLFLVRRRA